MTQQKLSKEQQEAAFYKDCEVAVLVEASAGSGKTRLLTERVRYLLTEKKDKFFSVLCLTFTNKAADEMKERLKGVPKLKERVFIGTFHEFCLQNIIRTRYIEIGLQNVPHIFDEDDKKEILEEVLTTNQLFENDYMNLPPKQQQSKLYDYLNYISERKRQLDLVIVGNSNSLEEEKKNILYEDYNDRMLSQNAIDYDDILLYAYRILTNRGDVIANLYRRLYKYILVDEAQDLNYAQYNIIKTICGEHHKNVFMVGDPNQAIYRFSGADIKFMKEDFVKDFDAKPFKISYNYRSSKKVLELANTIQEKEVKQDYYFEGENQILLFDDQQEEAKWVISEVKNWLNKGVYEEENKDSKEKIELENIAILARNRFVFSELINQLEKDTDLKEHFYLRKGVEKFEPDSLFIKIFDLGLRVISNPLNSLHFRHLLNKLQVQFDNSTSKVDFLLNIQNHNVNILSKSQLELLSDIWGKLFNNPKWLGNAITKLNDSVANLGLEDEERERVQADLQSLQSYWNDFVRNTNSSSQNIVAFRHYLSLNGAKEDKKGLTLATIHTVKGLEYEIVFLIGVNDGIIPDYRANDTSFLNEEKNTLYVAITRAKRCIYITYPKKRMMPWGDEKAQKISSFLKGINLTNSEK